jgi:hypothetical protein
MGFTEATGFTEAMVIMAGTTGTEANVRFGPKAVAFAGRASMRGCDASLGKAAKRTEST